jgi:hypothetical protein
MRGEAALPQCFRQFEARLHRLHGGQKLYGEMSFDMASERQGGNRRSKTWVLRIQEMPMRKFHLTLFIALFATACFAQSELSLVARASGSAAQEPGSQASAAVSSGERTVVGCVAQGVNGFVLKTEDGRTLNLRGATTDLSAYMGKKVQIHAQWTAKGLHVAAPLETTDTPAPAAAPPSGATDKQFAGSLNLQFTGKVLGDCLGKKKNK